MIDEYLFAPSGPEFLAIFVKYGLCVLAAGFLARFFWARDAAASAEAGHVAAFDLDDPYLIAYLRGGSDEVLRCAVAVLLDRGKAKLSETGAISLEPGAEKHPPEHTVERTVLDALNNQGQKGYTLAGRAAIKKLLASHTVAAESALRAKGLWSSVEAQGRAALVRWLTVAAIAIPGGVRLVRGISLGRPVSFLVILLVLFLAACLIVLRDFGTSPLGDQALEALRERFYFLQTAQVKKLKVAAADRPLVFAVFGSAAPLAGAFSLDSLWASFTPPQTSSSCSSGCGSSCGSSCGGGCGGGGCGG